MTFADVDAGQDLGRVVGRATPPVDAVAVLVVTGIPVAYSPAAPGESVRLHVDDSRDASSGRQHCDAARARLDEPLDVPAGDPRARATVSSHSWVTLTVDGSGAGRVSARSGESVELHLVEGDDLTVEIPRDESVHDDARGGVAPGKAAVQGGDTEVNDA